MPLEMDGCFDYEEFEDNVPAAELLEHMVNEIRLIKKLDSPLRPLI
jgi:hypothetical protein